MDALESIIIAQEGSRGGFIGDADKGTLYVKMATLLINLWTSQFIPWEITEDRVVLFPPKYQFVVLVIGYLLSAAYSLALHILIPPLLYVNKLVFDIYTGTILHRPQRKRL